MPQNYARNYARNYLCHYAEIHLLLCGIEVAWQWEMRQLCEICSFYIIYIRMTIQMTAVLPKMATTIMMAKRVSQKKAADEDIFSPGMIF